MIPLLIALGIILVLALGRALERHTVESLRRRAISAARLREELSAEAAVRLMRQAPPARPEHILPSTCVQAAKIRELERRIEVLEESERERRASESTCIEFYGPREVAR